MEDAFFFTIGIHLTTVNTFIGIKGIFQVNKIAIAEIHSSLIPGRKDNVSLKKTNSQECVSSQEIYISHLKNRTVQWNDAWVKRSLTFFDFYWPEAYTVFQGIPFQEYKDKEVKSFKVNQWVDSFYGEIHVEKEAEYWVSWFHQYLRMPSSSIEGIRKLYWKENEQGELKIVGMKWIPQELDLESSYLESITSKITAFIEGWRFAWETGDVEKYAVYYAEDSIQGDRRGKDAIIEHKRSTWNTRKPKEVSLTGLRVMAVKDGIQVDMAQSFHDALAYSDKGIKTLLLRPTGKSWVIVREDWSEILQ